MVSDICTTISGMMFGITWPSSTPMSRCPATRAASTKPASRASSFPRGHSDIKREIDNGGRQHDVWDGVTERCDDGHRQHEQRKRHDGIGQPAHQRVGPAAEEAGGEAGRSRPARIPARPRRRRCRYPAARRPVRGRRCRARVGRCRTRIARSAAAMPARCAGQRVVRCQCRAEQRRDDEQDEQRQGKPGDGIFRHHKARMAQRGGPNPSCAQLFHAPRLARGSSARFTMSMVRFSSTYRIAMVRTKPCTGAPSEAISASTA